MRYQQPYGISDTNAPYINGDPSIGRAGSIPPAAAFEYPMREIVTLITGGGLAPDDGDLQQLLKGVRTQFINYCTDVGVANSLGAGFSPPIAAYSLGMPFRIRVAATNTGASSFDAGAGRHPIKRVNGSDTAAGDLPAGGLIEVMWDGTNFQMTNYQGTGGGGTSFTSVNIPYIADTSATANSIVAPFSPAITTVAAGNPIEVKVKNTVTGPSTIFVNALSPVPVLNRFGGPLRPNDIVANEIVLFFYTGAAWQMAGSNPRGQVAIYKTPGTYTWVAPAGVYQADIQCWGGGAGGYNSTVGPLAITPGGTDGMGGCSAGYCRSFAVPIIPGNSYTLKVGAGGNRSFGEGGFNGTSSSFGSPAVLTATGGAWGNSNSWDSPGNGSGGDINLIGMAGWLCQVTTGTYGWNGAYGFGAPAPMGGIGGGPYLDGGWPGGGGGGGDFYGPVGSVRSGAGGDGAVIIRY